jgi:hypothetical protein
MTDDHTHRGDDVHSVEAAMMDYDEGVTGWKPIETAPKDGKMISVYSPDMSQYPCAAKWSLRENRWVEYTTADWCDPTHWMPLPAAPTEGE